MQYAVGLDKTKVSASCARTGMYMHSTVKKGFHDWTLRIDLATMPLRVFSHTAGTPTIVEGRKALISLVSDRGICEGVRNHMECRRISLRCAPVRGIGVNKQKSYLVSEMMAKKDVNSANGCDEGWHEWCKCWSFEGLNDAKWTYAVKNSLVYFTIGYDIFETRWKELDVREYADGTWLVKWDHPRGPRLSTVAIGDHRPCRSESSDVPVLSVSIESLKRRPSWCPNQ